MSDQQIGNEIRAAIRKGELEKVAALIGGDKAILDMMTPLGTFLHFAARKGQLDIVKLLVNMGAAVDVDGGISGGTALDQAASQGHLEIVRFLLDSGARMNTSVPEKNPLFAAIVGGHTDVARLLIERGISTGPGADDPEKTTPLSVARKWSREEIIPLLTSDEGERQNISRPDLPLDGGVDFKLLRRLVAQAARSAFSKARETRPDETFYAFALYTVDDAVVMSPSANTEEAYARARSKYASTGEYSEAGLVGNFRWSPYDWECDCVGLDAFDPAVAQINGRGCGRYDDSVDGAFVEFKAKVFATMVLALLDLEAEGFFGSGRDRRSVTVFCSVPHSGCTTWLEADSARRLNPPEVFETFHAERIEHISEGPDDLAPRGDVLYAKYLALVGGDAEDGEERGLGAD